MAEAFSLAVSLLAFNDRFIRYIRVMRESGQDGGQLHIIAARFSSTHALFEEFLQFFQSSPPPNLAKSTVQDQLHNLTERLISRIDNQSVFGSDLQRSLLKNAESVLNDFEMMTTRLHQVTLQSQVTQLAATTESMHKILLAVSELFENPMEADSENKGTEKNFKIETMRAKLHETLANNPWSRQPRNDPFCFAFVVLPVNPDGGVEPARGQVKIDTGAEDNWISTRLLEMASVPFNLDASLGTFRGANGQLFKPLGRVSVTWYSENQARTQKSDFLIHDSAPFDAILGSGWVLEECLNVFYKPVLPLFRMTMGPDEFKDLKKRQEATNASNDEVIALQRIEKRVRRERERQEEAQSRALSRITSPATLTRRNSSESLSTFPSFVPSKSTAGSSTPGIPAQGSATAGTELQVPGDDSKGKEKEGSNAATVL